MGTLYRSPTVVQLTVQFIVRPIVLSSTDSCDGLCSETSWQNHVEQAYCGSDGITYWNYCSLDKAICRAEKLNQKFSIKYVGECEDSDIDSDTNTDTDTGRDTDTDTDTETGKFFFVSFVCVCY